MKTCMWMFSVAFFMIAKKWKQSQCTSTGVWINKMRSIHKIEHYSAIKKMNYIYMLRFGWTLNTYWLKEATHKRPQSIWFLSMKYSRKGKSIEANKNRFPGAWHFVGDAEWLQIGSASFCDSKIGLWWWFHICKFTKNHWMVHLEWGNFMLCKLDLVKLFKK